MSPKERVLGGRAGTRWAFFDGFSIGVPGDPYLDRLRIIQTPWFGIYLHRIHRPDHDPDPHDHPWSFVSLRLSGHYIEEIRPDKQDPSGNLVRTRFRGTISYMPRQSAHRIIDVHGVLWTLVFVGPRRGDWGFWPDGKFVHWLEYNGTSNKEATWASKKKNQSSREIIRLTKKKCSPGNMPR